MLSVFEGCFHIKFKNFPHLFWLPKLSPKTQKAPFFENAFNLSSQSLFMKKAKILITWFEDCTKQLATMLVDLLSSLQKFEVNLVNLDVNHVVNQYSEIEKYIENSNAIVSIFATQGSGFFEAYKIGTTCRVFKVVITKRIYTLVADTTQNLTNIGLQSDNFYHLKLDKEGVKMMISNICKANSLIISDAENL